jgi:hypothetical protein
MVPSIIRCGIRGLQRATIPRSLSLAPGRLHLLPSRSAAIRSCAESFSSGRTGDDGDDPHGLFKEQMLELSEEREAIYGFTSEDHDAWSSAGKHKHHANFMKEIEEAREGSEERPQAAEPEAIADVSSSYAGLSHVSQDGKSVHMVDVGAKTATQRVAVAQCKVIFPPEVVEAFRGAASADGDLIGPKGPIFATATIAGILAAK